MATAGKLKWDVDATRRFEAGVSNVALFPMTGDGTYGDGVAWSGVTGIDENPSGADATDLYADNIKYATMRSAEKFDFTISAYDYPDAWAECDGSAVADGASGVYLGQQARKAFGLAYMTKIGDDAHPGLDKGSKLHLIYNSTASPSSRSYATINENPDAITFSWAASSTPTAVEGYKATCTVVVDETKAGANWSKLLDAIYGKDATTGTNPSAASAPIFLKPDQVIKLIKTGSYT